MKTYDLERNIRRVWDSACAAHLHHGATWYAIARAHAVRLALKHRVTVSQAAGVIAAISPGVRWEVNIECADELIGAWRKGSWETVSVPTYSYRNVRRAIAILEGARPHWPRGPKVTAFYRLILSGGTGPWIAIDGHAVNIAHSRNGSSIRGENAPKVKASEVDRVRLAYVRLSKKLSVAPSTLQAVTWVAWKANGQDELPF